MRRIGIISLCGNNNFGNKLQNYALYYYLKKMDNNEVYSIWIENNFEAGRIKSLLKIMKNNIINPKEIKRTKYFKKFNKEFLNFYKKRVIFNHDLKDISKDFDFLIVGSDQVWNYNIMNNFNTFFMLGCQTINISYAASFSCDNIPDNLKTRYKEGLENLDYISVREEKGKELAQALTDKNILVLVDPTLLLDKDDWKSVIKETKETIEGNYILLYFLGELSEERKERITLFSKEKKFKIINVLDQKSNFYNIGPQEFLYLIKNASLVFTDSFHACVFSMIFDKSFVIFNREGNGSGMESRIKTLISKFKLKDREYNGDSITDNNIKHDYSNAFKILQDEKKKSKLFLMDALRNMEGN